MAASFEDVDAYIENAAEFARPLLRLWRDLIHRECPDAEETTKWSMPFFTRKALLSNMTAFKGHCAFGFWHGTEVAAAAGFKPDDEAMGLLGRVTCLADFPPEKVICRPIREAVLLDDAGFKKSARPARPGRNTSRPRALRVGVRVPPPPRRIGMAGFCRRRFRSGW